uniref:Mu-like prophage protein gp29 n=1 Tax=Candidatus Kentrum sp. LPFa TaxID=2126335 RepID=A0A450WMP6_9GAMM|nr:MAG: Mu-like prophage protein gp29 [Candidatus Kentron sp. LPFa]
MTDGKTTENPGKMGKTRAFLNSIGNALRKPKTDRQAEARSTRSHPLHYASVRTLDPSRLARAFLAADDGQITEQASLFEMIEEQDTHIFAELSKRHRAVTSLEWQLQPPKDANQSEIDRTTELSELLADIPRFEDALYDLTDAIGKGFTALEIEWRAGSQWTPAALHFLPQRAFQVDRDTGALMLLKDGNPEPLREWGWIVHEHRARSGYIEQSALFRVLAWTYAYKAYDIQDMQRFLEVYGQPLRLGKYEAGTSKEAKNTLLKAVRNIGHDGAGIVPKTMEIDFIEAKSAGRVDDFLSAIRYWELKQSMAILGGTLTSQADGKTSTNALGKIHEKASERIKLHDTGQIEPTATEQLIRPIALINGMFPADRCPRFKFDTDETVDIQKIVQTLGDAAALGMEIDRDWAHKATQIPKADKGAILLRAPGGDQNTQKPKEKDAKAGLSHLLAMAALANKGQETGAPEAFAARLAQLSAARERALLEKISVIARDAGGYDAALSGIADLAMNDSAFADLAEDIALGTMAAELAGRAEIGRE